MLPDYLSADLKIVFCGTAAGRRSAALGHYYAGRGNRFWQLLADCGFTPRRLEPEEDHLVTSFGVGLTDLAKGVAGMDRDLPDGALVAEAARHVVIRYRPRALAFNGIAAAKVMLGARHAPGRVALERLDPVLRDTAIWVLPSTSGAARGWFELAPWQELAAFIGRPA